MKTLTKFTKTAVIIYIIIIAITCNAQVNTKNTIAVLNIDTQDMLETPEQMGNLTRMELDKLDIFQVLDKYDVSYLTDKNKLSITNCYGKNALVEVGKAINAEKMLTGSVEHYGETMVVTFRMIDVASGTIEKSHIKEFLYLPKETQTMLSMTLKEMYGMEIDKVLESKLTKPFNYDNSINNPEYTKLNLSGPRMGLTVFTGSTSEILQAPKNKGGYEAYPALFHFGYQFEAQYLNKGNFQALFEFIPMITGLDQNLFIPSLTIMHGLRNNRNGWEFAFGPTVVVSNKADGYYDQNKNWHLESEWTDHENPNPFPITTRMDSRGTPHFNSGFIFAFGKSFKSGRLNIPVNAFVIPAKDGVRFGASFGFNAKK
jgi:hypothetical protein